MDLGPRGKVAVVTAASGGLDRAIAEEFAARPDSRQALERSRARPAGR